MKKMPFLSLLLLSLMLTPTAVMADNFISTASSMKDTSQIQPYGNITGYKYKTYEGKLWKRLWSYTYNRWEDPNWTLVS